MTVEISKWVVDLNSMVLSRQIDLSAHIDIITTDSMMAGRESGYTTVLTIFERALEGSPRWFTPTENWHSGGSGAKN